MTIAGHGEPTLHPEFDEITDRLCALRDRVAPSLPIAVLSNSTTCMYSDVSSGLRRLDERCMKLDGGDAITLRHINGTRVPIDTIIDGLAALGPITVQAMFVSDAAGRIDNCGEGAVNEWLAAIERLRPLNVQVYTLGRSPALASLQPVSIRRLREIAEHVRAAGIPAEVFGGGKLTARPSVAPARRGRHVWKTAPPMPEA
jgi:wyosine [tRNA(Phe)-imidazoG37] synthetase (radical SAM superfamily)